MDVDTKTKFDTKDATTGDSALVTQDSSSIVPESLLIDPSIERSLVRKLDFR